MAERRITAATRRAKEMMVGGLAAGHAVGLLIIAAAWLLGSPEATFTAALGFASVVIFYSVGQAIEVVASEMEPMQGMGLVLVSYAVRVIGIAAGLWTLLALPQVAPHVVDGWLLLSVVGTVLAWVTGVVVVAARQRVPVYDHEYRPPDEQP